MRLGHTGIAAAFVLAAAPALAGEEVLYGPPAPWIDRYDTQELDPSAIMPLALYDVQQRLEDGTLTIYVDRAFKLASPEALTQAGTATAVWMPDQGDLTIHSVEILRGDEVIDVLAGGARYTVLRRETQLEQRQLDGALTATMAVPGLHIGDILHIAYSQTIRDQALQGEVQASASLLASPMEVQFARSEISWPVGEDVHWSAGPKVDAVKEREEGGYRYVSVALPLPEREELPASAPSRFSRPPILLAGTFRDWQQVSQVFAPLYRIEGAIEPGGALAGEVDKIRQASADPLARMVLATRLVQERISYLANGMSGGNYVPQSPAETWQLRYGDCKAKSLLLLALLDALGIRAEPVLVNSAIGDAVPDLLPMPSAFDHVIVRAEIDGTSYWLDGTLTGTRLANVADTPAFRFALPLRPAGAGLMPIEPRIPAVPMVTMDLTLDQRGGVDLPTLATAEARFSGALGSNLSAALKQAGTEQRKDLANTFAASIEDDLAVFDSEMDYDEESGIARVLIRGLMTSPWEREGARERQSFDQLASSELSFEEDRARPAWREIPVELGGASVIETNLRVLLPVGEDGYQLGGRPDVDLTFAGSRIVRKAALAENVLTINERVEALGGELPASAIPAEKAKAARIKNSAPYLLAPANTTFALEYGRPELRERIVPYEAAYAAAILREPEKASSYLNRALFRWRTTDLDGALQDYDKAIEIDPTAGNFRLRGVLRQTRAEPGKALEDFRKAFEISPSIQTALDLARVLGQQGETEEALALIEEYDDYGDYHEVFVQTRADILAYVGRGEEGLGEIEKLIAERPDKTHLLNASCWLRARFAVGAETMMAVCNRAVERAANPAAVLDSRALAWFRIGDLEKARADAEAALALAPDSANTRYLRAFVLRKLGDPAAEENIAYLARILPGMAAEYARYGLKP